ncbi:hypothetical protein VTJ49DRAFT_861 [Mycothermus thermophilus]|uniref:RING-type E3 ubiquitin transferase n=1 Tax=Humicola insolens TaxID=85995 RepID=A0ABR3VNV3_HUMIN
MDRNLIPHGPWKVQALVPQVTLEDVKRETAPMSRHPNSENPIKDGGPGGSGAPGHKGTPSDDGAAGRTDRPGRGGSRGRQGASGSNGGPGAPGGGGRPGRDVNDNQQSESELDRCAICLEPLSSSSPCEMRPCHHSQFHYSCLKTWLERNPVCPLCKTNVEEVRHTNPQGDATFFLPAPRSDRGERGGPPALPPSVTRGLGIVPGWAIYWSQRQRVIARQPSRRPEAGDAFDPRNPANRVWRQESEVWRPSQPEVRAVLRRRHIYRCHLFSLHVGSNPISGYRELPSPAEFSSNPALITRARLWIQRELRVFSFFCDLNLDDRTAGDITAMPHRLLLPRAGEQQMELRYRRAHDAWNFLEYVIEMLKTIHLQDPAGRAEARLVDYLGPDHTRLFLHELRSWLRSPARSLEEWDQEVQYPAEPHLLHFPEVDLNRRQGDTRSPIQSPGGRLRRERERVERDRREWQRRERERRERREADS